MRIFGGIVPFIGWREITIDANGHPCEDGVCLDPWRANAIEVEWLGRGAVLFIGRIWRKYP